MYYQIIKHINSNHNGLEQVERVGLLWREMTRPFRDGCRKNGQDVGAICALRNPGEAAAGRGSRDGRAGEAANKSGVLQFSSWMVLSHVQVAC